MDLSTVSQKVPVNEHIEAPNEMHSIMLIRDHIHQNNYIYIKVDAIFDEHRNDIIGNSLYLIN